MWSPSELVDGSEPHDHICSAVRTGVADDDTVAAWRGVPGVAGLGGYREGLYRVLPSQQTLRLI